MSVSATGENALHCAAAAGAGNVVQELLAKGIDVQSVTANGQTALHYAALGDNESSHPYSPPPIPTLLGTCWEMNPSTQTPPPTPRWDMLGQ